MLAEQPEWFLQFCGSGYVQRWHAKCVADSDFAAVRGKRTSAHDRHMCDCGEAVESTRHIHLECALYLDFRRALFEAIDAWLEKVRDTESSTTGWERMNRAEALQWVHHNSPLVTDPLTAAAGEQVRHAALAFYSQVQQERYATGRSHRLPEAEPMAISIEASSQETQGVCDTSSPANQSPLGFG